MSLSSPLDRIDILTITMQQLDALVNVAKAAERVDAQWGSVLTPEERALREALGRIRVE